MKEVLIAIFNTLKFWELAVAAIFTLFCLILYRLDKTSGPFKFYDFFTSGDWPGKASVARLGYFGGFLSHSLVLMHREFDDDVSVEMASFYALIWSGAYVALKAIEMKGAKDSPPNSSSSTSTTIATTTEKSNEPRATDS